MNNSGDETVSINENSCGEETISIEGTKMPVDTHITRREDAKRIKVSFPVHEDKYIIFCIIRIRKGVTHGNIPIINDRIAIKSLTVGLP